MKNIVGRLSVHKEHELLLKLEAAGLTDELAQKVIDSKYNELAKCVVRIIANGGFEPALGHKRAREIMGRNMFGVEEAIRHFGITPLRQQIACLSEIPFSEETLELCKETHVLIAVLSFSILEIREASSGMVAKSQHLIYYGDFYTEAFAKEKGETEWKLVRKTPVENSTSKTWPEQQALLIDSEETPTAQTMAYTIIGHFLATGERLFKKICTRCSDVDSDGDRILVGPFDSDGLFFRYRSDDARDESIGVSAAMKSE
jgi:hypothetical protein